MITLQPSEAGTGSVFYTLVLCYESLSSSRDLHRVKNIARTIDVSKHRASLARIPMLSHDWSSIRNCAFQKGDSFDIAGTNNFKNKFITP